MRKFNQQVYIQEYNKKHYKAFKVDLKEEERESLMRLIKQAGFSSNREFLLECIKMLENGSIKKEG